MKTIVLATNNQHKLEEFRQILINYEILSLKDIDYYDEIEETGNTFEENALIKAKTISNYLKEENKDYIVIADDSGLCVPSLNNAPGIYSARYAGINATDKDNRNKLLKELKDKEKDAYFNCTIVIYYPNNTYKVACGKTYGKIIDKEEGSNGFGYDPIFYSNELNKTFGIASNLEKNKVSHRAKAIEELLKII